MLSIKHQLKQLNTITDMDTKKEMPWDFWNYGINPILGYKWNRPTLNPTPPRNKNEYNKEDAIKL